MEEAEMASSPNSGSDFLVSFLFNFAICILLIIAFLIFRRRLSFFFFPNVKEQPVESEPDGVDPPGLFGWVKPTWSTPLVWFQRNRGLDALLYLRFLKSCIALFAVNSLIGLVILIPTNAAGGNNKLPQDNPLHVSGLDVISMANISPGSDLYWVHAVCVVLITTLAIAGTYRQYLGYARLRFQYRHEDTIYNRSVLATNVNFREPESSFPTKDKVALVRRRFEEVFPSRVTAVSLPRHDADLINLRKRETSLRIKLTRACLKQHKAKKPLTHRTGTLGCSGPTVETIPYLREQLEDVQEQITAMQANEHAPLARVALITFAEQQDARDCVKLGKLDGRRNSPLRTLQQAGSAAVAVGQSVGKSVLQAGQTVSRVFTKNDKTADSSDDATDEAGEHDEHAHEKDEHYTDAGAAAEEDDRTPLMSPVQIDPTGSVAERFSGAMSLKRGPEYSNVFWEFIHVHSARAAASQALSWILLIFLFFFWAIPVSAIQALGNLRELAENPAFSWLIPFLDFVGPTIESWINAYLPSLLLVLLMSLVVPIIKFITFREGHPTYARANKLVLDRFFTFLVLNVFLVTTIAGSLLSQISDILNGETTVALILAQTLPSQGAFFVEYIMVKFTFVAMELLRADIFFLQRFRRLILSSSPNPPRDLNYASRYGWDLLVVVISLTYSVMFPLISIFATAYFIFAYFVHRHNFLFIHKPRVHSGGALWSRTYRNIIFGLCIFQFTMIGALSLASSTATILVALNLLVSLYLAYKAHNLSLKVRKDGALAPGERLLPFKFSERLNDLISDESTQLVERHLPRSYGRLLTPEAAAIAAAAQAANDAEYYAEPALIPIIHFVEPVVGSHDADAEQLEPSRESLARVSMTV